MTVFKECSLLDSSSALLLCFYFLSIIQSGRSYKLVLSFINCIFKTDRSGNSQFTFHGINNKCTWHSTFLKKKDNGKSFLKTRIFLTRMSGNNYSLFCLLYLIWSNTNTKIKTFKFFQSISISINFELFWIFQGKKISLFSC